MASLSTEAEEKQKPWLFVGIGIPGSCTEELATMSAYKPQNCVRIRIFDELRFPSGISLPFYHVERLISIYVNKYNKFQKVGSTVSYYKIPLKQVLVMFDNLDLPFAKLKLLPKGGHGGHNGMRSIINHFKGSHDFRRLRIGIGRLPGKMNPASFVLRLFTRHEQEELDFTFQNDLETVRILVQGNFDKSATFVNTSKPMRAAS